MGDFHLSPKLYSRYRGTDKRLWDTILPPAHVHRLEKKFSCLLWGFSNLSVLQYVQWHSPEEQIPCISPWRSKKWLPSLSWNPTRMVSFVIYTLTCPQQQGPCWSMVLHLSWTQVPPAENGPRRSMPQETAHSLFLAAAALCVSVPIFTLGFTVVKVYSLCTKILETAGSSEQTEIYRVE